MRVLGIFRGFPGLGRVVAGVSLLEELRDQHNCEIEIISYLQGNKYLATRGYRDLQEASPMDYSSIGLLPTNRMGAFIHRKVREFNPDLIIIDGEPLIIQSLKISNPNLKILVLLNPADIHNPSNDQDAMNFFKYYYGLADIVIVHGLRKVDKPTNFNTKDFYSINTILRQEILQLQTQPKNEIYCILGGGTVNVNSQFKTTTLNIAKKVLEVAPYFPMYIFNIVCGSENIFKAISKLKTSSNVFIHKNILSAETCYSRASLVITRAGRNTTSELLYLGIPAITCAAGDRYRSMEQAQNISMLNSPQIVHIHEQTTTEEIVKVVKEFLGKKNEFDKFEPGNAHAITLCLNLLKK